MLLEGYQIMKKLLVEGYYCVNKRPLNDVTFLKTKKESFSPSSAKKIKLIHLFKNEYQIVTYTSTHYCCHQ